jgi:PncC family amidohydrolase
MTADRVPSDEELHAAAVAVGERLEREGGQLVVAESCTGGLVGDLLTDIPKASNCFPGGIICYSPEVKERLLNVSGDLLQQRGAVSEEVARAMVVGLFDRFPSATAAVAITGLSGPDGDGEGKPIGLTYVAVGRRGGTTSCERRIFGHDRIGNKRAAALLALQLIAAE